MWLVQVQFLEPHLPQSQAGVISDIGMMGLRSEVGKTVHMEFDHGWL